MWTTTGHSCVFIHSAALRLAAKLPGAVQNVLRDITEKHRAVVFNGDGYSEAWHREAELRGLPNLKTTVDALPVMGQPEIVELFVKYGVLSKREIESRMDIYLEQYVKTLNVESKLVIEMGRTMLFPAAIRYQSELAVTCANLKAVGFKFDTDTLDKVTALVKLLQDNIAVLEKAMQHQNGGGLLDEATHYLHEIVPAMAAGAAKWPTLSKVSWPTTCGRFRPIRRCCSSSSSEPGREVGHSLSSAVLTFANRVEQLIPPLDLSFRGSPPGFLPDYVRGWLGRQAGPFVMS